MRQVLTTYDLSLAVGLRLALEAANIEHSTNFGDGVDPTRAALQVFVVDRDYDRARRLLNDLQVTGTTDSGGRFVLVGGILFAILVVASVVVFIINALRG